MNGCSRMRGGVPSLFFGLLILGAGVLLLLDSAGLFEIGPLWKYWPVILVGAGLSKIVSAPSSGRLFGGTLFVGGVVLLGRNLGYWSINTATLWALLLIAFGAHLLLRAIGRRPGAQELTKGGSDSQISAWTAFGGLNQRSTSQDFTGGALMAVFGGIEYDLRQASTTKNQMTIDANALFGGVELQVPTSWTVILKGVAVFGGYEDKTAPPPPGAGPELIVTGHAIFGGVSITN